MSNNTYPSYLKALDIGVGTSTVDWSAIAPSDSTPFIWSNQAILEIEENTNLPLGHWHSTEIGGFGYPFTRIFNPDKDVLFYERSGADAVPGSGGSPYIKSTALTGADAELFEGSISYQNNIQMAAKQLQNSRKTAPKQTKVLYYVVVTS